jgi:Baseplate J-like protein
VSLTSPDFPAYYVQLDVTTDDQTLADQALANLQAVWGPDWTPNDGNQEVVLVETLAAYAAVAANNMALMTDAAFIALCSNLFGIPYTQGSPATTTVTLTFQDTNGNYYVPAGSEFDLSGYAFQTAEDVYSQNQAQVTGVLVVSNDTGQAFNQLDSSNWSNVTLPVWVTNLQTEAPTSDGTDAQDDPTYLNYASRELQLRGRMVVTLPDYEIVALDTPGVGRAYAQTDSERNVTVTLTDPNGEPVPQTVKDTLSATYAAARLVNVTVTLADADYSTIDVAYEVMCQPGFDPTALEDSVNANLAQQLSPMGWGTVVYGQAGSGPTTWINDPTVRLNKLIAVVGATAGVAYVVSLTINGDAADFTMPGVAPLPQPGTFTGTVDVQP